MAYFYDDQDDLSPPFPPSRVDEPKAFPKINQFHLSDDQRSALNKHLPRGFCLIRKGEYERLQPYKKAPSLKVEYIPKSRDKKINLDDPVVSTIDQVWQKKKQIDARKSQKVIQSAEGRSRQMQRIKNIIQRFRKHNKYPILSAHLNKIGLLQGLNEIQTQNKKAYLLIDTFKERMTLVLETAKGTTFEQNIIEVIDQMIEELQCYCEQARKAQFQKSIEAIQKSIDKVTRFVSESTDPTKTIGLMYAKKKRKPERNETYSQKEIIYIGELINKLPKAYLIGIWEIIEEKPFCEITKDQFQLRLFELSTKKLREVELYVKGKLSLIWRSKERKRQKLEDQDQENQQDIEKEESKQGAMEESAQRSEGWGVFGKKPEMIKQVPEENLNDDYDEVNSFLGLNKNKEANIDSILEEEDEFVMPPIDISIPKQIEDGSSVSKYLETPKFKYAAGNLKNQEKQLQELAFLEPMIGAEAIDNLSDSSMITDEDDSDF